MIIWTAVQYVGHQNFWRAFSSLFSNISTSIVKIIQINIIQKYADSHRRKIKVQGLFTFSQLLTKRLHQTIQIMFGHIWSPFYYQMNVDFVRVMETFSYDFHLAWILVIGILNAAYGNLYQMSLVPGGWFSQVIWNAVLSSHHYYQKSHGDCTF